MARTTQVDVHAFGKLLALFRKDLRGIGKAVREAEGLLRDSELRAVKMDWGNLVAWFDAVQQQRAKRRENLKAASYKVHAAEKWLSRRSVKTLRKVRAGIDMELGRRAAPGRPRAMDSHEELEAAQVRWRGKSWAQVLRHVNDARQRVGRPDVPLSTIRTVVASLDWTRAKKPIIGSRKAKTPVS